MALQPGASNKVIHHVYDMGDKTPRNLNRVARASIVNKSVHLLSDDAFPSDPFTPDNTSAPADYARTRQPYDEIDESTSSEGDDEMMGGGVPAAARSSGQSNAGGHAQSVINDSKKHLEKRAIVFSTLAQALEKSAEQFAMTDQRSFAQSLIHTFINTMGTALINGTPLPPLQTRQAPPPPPTDGNRTWAGIARSGNLGLSQSIWAPQPTTTNNATSRRPAPQQRQQQKKAPGLNPRSDTELMMMIDDVSVVTYVW